MKGVTIVAAAAMLSLPISAEAQGTSASDRVLKSLTDCRKIAADDQRLACFDKATSALEQAVSAKTVQIIDKGDVKKARRSLFGFTLPNLNIFGGGDDDKDEDAFTEINTTIASARTVENGRVEIRLADEGNAVWRTTDTGAWPPKPGTKIRIRKGALGNYFLNFDGRSYRGMRLR